MHVTPDTLDELTARARSSPRRRHHLLLHASQNEPCQRMVIAMEPDSYIQPHRHPDSTTNEALLALRGAFALIVFDDVGEVADVRKLGVECDVAVAELEPHVWHTVLALEAGAVLFEAKSGPFRQEAAKRFAPWAPSEDAPEAEDYLRQLFLRASSALGT